MSYTINWLVFALLIFATSVICIIAFKKTHSSMQRIYVIFITVSMVIYSGIGTSFLEIGHDYTLRFIVFYALTMLMMTLVFNIKFKNTLIKTESTSYYLKNSFMIIFVVMFFSVYFVRLIYPEFKLMNIINPPPLSLIDIFARRAALRSNPLLEAAQLLNLLAMPFFMIYLQRKMIIKKWKVVVFIIVLWIYLQTVSLGYISRHQIVVYLIFLGIIIANRNNKAYHLSKKIILVCGTIIIISMPIFLTYETIRLGGEAANIGFFESVSQLIYNETDYAKYYDACMLMHRNDLWTRYFYWFFTLPIPSFIAGGIKDGIFNINQYFTEQITGIYYGSYGYSVVLPSVFGESLMLYGKMFYWLHGMFIGTFYGLVCRGLEKNSELQLMNLYFITYSLFLGRGGTNSPISLMVNSMVMYLLFMIFLRLFVRKFKFKR